MWRYLSLTLQCSIVVAVLAYAWQYFELSDVLWPPAAPQYEGPNTIVVTDMNDRLDAIASECEGHVRGCTLRAALLLAQQSWHKPEEVSIRLPHGKILLNAPLPAVIGKVMIQGVSPNLQRDFHRRATSESGLLSPSKTTIDGRGIWRLILAGPDSQLNVQSINLRNGGGSGGTAEFREDAVNLGAGNVIQTNAAPLDPTDTVGGAILSFGTLKLVNIDMCAPPARPGACMPRRARVPPHALLTPRGACGPAAARGQAAQSRHVRRRGLCRGRSGRAL